MFKVHVLYISYAISWTTAVCRNFHRPTFATHFHSLAGCTCMLCEWSDLKCHWRYYSNKIRNCTEISNYKAYRKRSGWSGLGRTNFRSLVGVVICDRLILVGVVICYRPARRAHHQCRVRIWRSCRTSNSCNKRKLVEVQTITQA